MTETNGPNERTRFMALKYLLQSIAGSFGYVVVRKETLENLLEKASRDDNRAEQAKADDVASAKQDAEFPAKTADLEDDPLDTVDDGSSLPLLADYENLSAAKHFEQGQVCSRAGNEGLAFQHFSRALGLVPRYEPAMKEMKRISQVSLADAREMLKASPRGAVPLLVRAIEADPSNGDARNLLNELLGKRTAPDLTTMCFIFYDGDRARQIHGEAYKRVLEFVTIGGVVGEVLEFGVLGGWSARLICETMRDLGNLSRVYLFELVRWSA